MLGELIRGIGIYIWMQNFKEMPIFPAAFCIFTSISGTQLSPKQVSTEYSVLVLSVLLYLCTYVLNNLKLHSGSTFFVLFTTSHVALGKSFFRPSFDPLLNGVKVAALLSQTLKGASHVLAH